MSQQPFETNPSEITSAETLPEYSGGAQADYLGKVLEQAIVEASERQLLGSTINTIIGSQVAAGRRPSITPLAQKYIVDPLVIRAAQAETTRNLLDTIAPRVDGASWDDYIELRASRLNS